MISESVFAGGGRCGRTDAFVAVAAVVGVAAPIIAVVADVAETRWDCSSCCW